MSVYTTNDDELCCPLCGETNTHVVAAVDSDTDLVPASRKAPANVGHRFGLYGWCEHCAHRFALLFTSYRGSTYVETRDLDEIPSAQVEAS